MYKTKDIITFILLLVLIYLVFNNQEDFQAKQYDINRLVSPYELSTDDIDSIAQEVVRYIKEDNELVNQISANLELENVDGVKELQQQVIQQAKQVKQLENEVDTVEIQDAKNQNNSNILNNGVKGNNYYNDILNNGEKGNNYYYNYDASENPKTNNFEQYNSNTENTMKASVQNFVAESNNNSNTENTMKASVQNFLAESNNNSNISNKENNVSKNSNTGNNPPAPNNTSNIYNTEGLNSTIQSGSMYQSITEKNGNVGIGTNEPTDKLHVKNGNLIIENTCNSNIDNKIIFREDYPTQDSFFIGTELCDVNPQDQSMFFGFKTGINPGASDSLMNIKGHGNVGIGTNEPKAKLDIKDGQLIVSPPGTTPDGSTHYDNLRPGKNGKASHPGPSGWGGGICSFDLWASSSVGAGIEGDHAKASLNNKGELCLGNTCLNESDIIKVKGL